MITYEVHSHAFKYRLDVYKNLNEAWAALAEMRIKFDKSGLKDQDIWIEKVTREILRAEDGQ